MNGLARIALCGVMFGLVSASSGLAAEEKKVDNPQYKHWAQFKPGSYATLKMVAIVAGTTSNVSMTRTLKEITAEKAVVEIKTIMQVAGQNMEQPPTLQPIPAKFTEKELKEQQKQEQEGKIKEGKEEIKVAGKTFKAKWVETEFKQSGMTIKSKTWTSEEVPGQLLRTASTTEGSVQTKSTGELVKFKAIKK
ncbi:MAG: hypothetical protein KAV82_08695 [Phycisphaerae bacterium]|nr:hypothetical protein [Phycisphaerae bacterium]